MRFSLRCLPVFSIGLLLVGCQGDTPAPVALDRTLEGAPAIKCPWDKSVTDVYENKFKNDKIAACQDAAEFVAAQDITAAELVINELLVALYNDYAVCVGPPFLPFGTYDPDCRFKDGVDVPAGVVKFAQATCAIAEDDLPQDDDVDCVVPTVENLALPIVAPTDPTAEKAGGWIVVGPVGEGAIVELQSDEFAIQIDDLIDDLEHPENSVTEVFVAMRENDPTPVNTCPDTTPGCVGNNYTIDADGVGQPYYDNDPIDDDPFPGLYVEICEGEVDDFRAVSVPARCAGGTCTPSQPAADRGYTGCSKGALAFAPSTWSAVADSVRDVRCVVTSTSAAVSEGTTCTVLDDSGDPVVPLKTCTTVATGPKLSACLIPDGLVAADSQNEGGPIDYTMYATKITSGVSHNGSWGFQLSQTNPMFGDTLDVPVDVEPPGQ